MDSYIKSATFLLFIICFFFLFTNFEVHAEQIRLSGDNRFETAAAISKEGWETSETVILAQASDFPDALASVPLAKKLNSPILLTQPQNLPNETIDEIKRLTAKHVIILGGPLAVSKSIEDYLTNTMKVSVKRIGGENRFKTAEAIANELGQYDKAFIVNAYNFPDALSIAPYAAITGSAILISNSDTLTMEMKQAALKASERYVIGGTAAIKDSIATELKAKRIAGSNRYGTSANILKAFYKTQPNLYFTTGVQFSDALSGSALAAKNSSGIALVKPNEIPAEIEGILSNYQVSKSFILGGTQAIDSETSANLDSKVIYEITDKSKPVIFYSPHADDELLAAGAGIDFYLNKGFDVHVVLMTDGEASDVYKKLQSIYPDMTLDEFGEARVREFKDAVSRLGVKDSNIHIYNYPDSGLTVENVKSVILEFENKFPGAEHRALSFEETHSDHLATGIALNDLYWSGKVKNARFYISPYLQNQINGFYLKPISPGNLLDALYAYKLYNPDEGRYSIGYLSVPELFNTVENEPLSKVEMPNKNFVDTKD
ncbi:cell wall-binding repeat-containing protein [Bacillus sp. EB600]|uniref:cell wall-binding repeat-containing protein n=1 Tax=Bacillus sp. EB600 TaxID=2806345 RepID=UPI00210A3438|nr:cell wall-binding repeat-containing protein [Bacillus sp. EB600]MCQ6278656.1 cell wall-binding repeat-containing protein [Bacillus sp. EB600]